MLHIRLPADDLSVLDALANNILSRQQVATMLLHAAVEAVQANGGRVHLPPKFTVANDEDSSSFAPASPRINQPTKKK